MSTHDLLQLQVICAWPERAFEITLQVPAGITAGDLLARSGVRERFPELANQSPALAVYGKVIAADYVMRAGERLEVLRSLLNDPKHARRQRARAAQTPPTRVRST